VSRPWLCDRTALGIFVYEMTCEYTWPDAAALSGEPNKAAIASIEYGCSTCDIKVCSSDVFKIHIDGGKHKKKLIAACLVEDPNVSQQLEEYAELEQPHRDMRHAAKSEMWKAALEKKKAALEGLTAEQKKALTEEKTAAKRKRIEDGTQGISKKAKAKERCKMSYECKLCEVEQLNSQQQFAAHMQSPKHLRNVMDYIGGCWACAAKAPQQDSHFEGKKHLASMAKLEEFGVNTDQMGETGWLEFTGPPQPRGPPAHEHPNQKNNQTQPKVPAGAPLKFGTVKPIGMIVGSGKGGGR